MASSAVVASTANDIPLKSEQSLKAAKALLAHISKSATEPVVPAKRSLLDDESDPDATLAETPIWLNIVSKRHIVSKPHLRPSKVHLPHPLHTNDNVTICLITADPQRAYKDHIADEKFPEELRRRISRVIGFKKLQAKFSQYEAQRALYAAHDIFLADDRIINRLPPVLGKTFFKTTTKRPIPVVLSANPNSKKPNKAQNGKKQPTTREEQAPSIGTHEQVAREIERALGAALVTLNPSPQICVKAGTANMSPEDLAENLNALALAVVDKHVPQKWKNVKGVFVKGPQTAALPIWQTDALWLEGKDVVQDGQALENGSSKKGDSSGKKRKAQDDEADNEAPVEGSPLPKKMRKDGGKQALTEEVPSGPAPKKFNKGNKGVKAKPKRELKREPVPDSNDSQLDMQISERKAKLKEQKRAARRAMDD